MTLAIGGMTCGACASRVERVLNAVDGVSASVNYASERASVQLTGDVPLQSLLERIAAAGYSASPISPDAAQSDDTAEDLDRRVASLRRRLIVAGVLFMPLCDASILFSVSPSARFGGWQWLMVALAAPVVTWAALPFYEAAIRGARHRTTTMDTLVSIGIVAATAWSLYSMFFLDRSSHGSLSSGLGGGSGGGIYLDVPAGVTAFLLAGRFFEAWSKRRSGNALRALAAVAPREVCVLGADGSERLVRSEELRVGQSFVVRPGQTVASDGEVLAGESAMDQSVMTGEPEPVDVGAGAAVLGGTIALSGRIVVRAARVGAETQLGQMLAMVQRAQNEKAAVQRLADRVCSIFVPAVLLASLGTLLIWLALGNPGERAFSAALCVLIIACPCALGLATPAALLVSSWTGARLGIFFKGYASLESSRHVDTVLLDKTGTLTEGRMSVAEVQTADGFTEEQLLRLAGAVEAASEHPIGRAIARLAQERAGALPAVTGFEALPGMGARGAVEGSQVYVGRIGATGPWESAPSSIALHASQWQSEGRTVVLVQADGSVAGALALADSLRPSAAAAVRELRALGLRCVMVTGDNASTAHALAERVGIEEVVAGALPTEKVELIARLRAQGRCVAMVGDGVNDAPALAAADLGLAVGSGTDVAINAADLIIARDDLRATATAIELARRTLRTIHSNLAWAFAYNLAAIPLAAVGLLDPLIAGAAMALSSSFVVWNSSRLRHAGIPGQLPTARDTEVPARRALPGTASALAIGAHEQ